MQHSFLQRILQQTAAVDRRSFLSSTGYGLLSASVFGQLTGCASNAQPGGGGRAAADTVPVKLPPLDHPSEPSMPPPPAPLDPAKRVGFALVGLGHLTLDELLPAFGQCKYAKPVALVSGDAAKAKKVAAQYGIDSKSIYNYQNYDEMKANPAIQVVYIVLPNSMHEEFTVRAAAAGKHVLCEKPMATSAAEAKRMIDACKAANKKLMIAYRIQYEPKNRVVKEWTRSKKWGKVGMIEMYIGQNVADGTWRTVKKLAGGGSLPDIGLYCLNTARYLTGEEPEWVSANIHSDKSDPRFKEVEDHVMWSMGMPSGTVINAASSYSIHDSRRYRCLADRGGWFGLDPAFAYRGLEIEASEVRDNKAWKISPDVTEKNQFALEMDHMAQCVLNNQEPYTPGEEGWQDHRIMEAIYRSAQEKKVIQLERITKVDAFRGTPPKEGA